MFAAHRPLRAAALLALAAVCLVGTACSDESEDATAESTTTTTEATTTTESTTTTEVTTTSAPQTPTNDSEFCQRTSALIGVIEPAAADIEAWSQAAPDEIRGPVDVYVETLNANDGDAVAVLDDPEGAEAINAIAAFALEDCGLTIPGLSTDGQQSN